MKPARILLLSAMTMLALAAPALGTTAIQSFCSSPNNAPFTVGGGECLPGLAPQIDPASFQQVVQQCGGQPLSGQIITATHMAAIANPPHCGGTNYTWCQIAWQCPPPAPGCQVSISGSCPAYPGNSNTTFHDDWAAQNVGADTNEAACLNRAMDWEHACSNQVSVMVRFTPTGKQKSVFPGCNITLGGSCPAYSSLSNSTFHDDWAAAYVGADSNEAACLNRAHDWIHACGNAIPTTALFVPTGQSSTVFPGCNITIAGNCPAYPSYSNSTFHDDWAAAVVGADVNEAACLNRAYDWTSACAGPVKTTALFLPTEHKNIVSYGCGITLTGACPSYPNLANTTFHDDWAAAVVGADTNEAACLHRATDWVNACVYASATALYLPTRHSATVYPHKSR